MNTGRLVFAQLLDFLPRHEFNRCVRRYRGNFHCRSLSCHDQFLCLAFAQLTGCESLRQIETCLEAMEREALPRRPSLGRRRAARWPTPTSGATGASTPTSRRD